MHRGPGQILPGGYISWVNVEKDEWQQLLYVDPSKPSVIKNIDKADSSKSLREWIEGLEAAKRVTRASRKVNTPKAKALFKYSAKRIVAIDRYAIAKAKFYKLEASTTGRGSYSYTALPRNGLWS